MLLPKSCLDLIINSTEKLGTQGQLCFVILPWSELGDFSHHLCGDPNPCSKGEGSCEEPAAVPVNTGLKAGPSGGMMLEAELIPARMSSRHSNHLKYYSP